MGHVRQSEGMRGSQKWIQRLVNDQTPTLDRAIHDAGHGKIGSPIQWRCPLRADGYAEYSDQSFLDLLGIRLPHRPLSSFWPTRGPQWDALGVSSDGAAILVEAKAHTSEAASPGSGASKKSLALIRESLAEVQRHFGVDASHEWTETYYQYANRLAHLYLLRELNNVPAWLVFLYLVGDEEMGGPKSPGEWTATRRATHEALGIRSEALPHVIDVYVDVRTLAESVR